MDNNNNKKKNHVCFLVVAIPVWCFLKDLMLIVELMCV